MLVQSKLEPACEEAVGLMHKGLYGDAATIFTDVLKKDPNSPLAWNNRGLCLLSLGHPFDAVMNLDKAIAIAPEEPAYPNNRGACYLEQGDAVNALADYDRAVALRQDFPEAHNNRGNALKYLGRLKEAAEAYKTSISYRPDYADAHLHLSFTELALGNYESGWKEFEWRWKSGQIPERGLPFPKWEGEDLNYKKLLLYSEQGHGDCLQFIRYATEIKRKYINSEIFVEVRMPLARLAKTVPGVDGVLILGEKIPDDIDYQVAMMSVPRVMGTTVDTIPHKVPYFEIDKHRIDAWKGYVNQLPEGLKVGICWAGMSRPGQPAAASVDKKRSTTLSTFAPLALIPGVSWVSLQKGPPEEQVQNPPPGMTIGHWTSEMEDFYDTGAMIENLDLVITVDTAVVHLAAALGKPTWLLSRWDGCWRWLGNRADSPWYPTLTQYVQDAPGDWGSVMEKVSNDLKSMVKAKAA